MCAQCAYKATQKIKLQQHVQSVHNGVKYNCVQCDYKACGYKASQKENLQKHVQSVHNGLKYNCVQCDHKATQKQSIKQHG